MTKVLIYSPNLLSPSMAGAAIRSWEFAKALCKDYQVVLISQEEPQISSSDFEVLSFRDPLCREHFRGAAVLIAQRLTFPLALIAKFHRLKIIIDAYVPGPLELMEHFKSDPVEMRKGKVFSEISNLILSFKMADGVLCASEKQRDLWIGFLLGQKLIHPSIYDQDPDLSCFLAAVPFGLSSTPPQKKGAGLKENLGLSTDDIVLLWGGGIWNWFDPLTLIKAMKILKGYRPDVKLVFMGVNPPEKSLPVTSMSERAILLAKECGLFNETVYFHEGWVPYEERQNFLLDASIGVSTHFNHLETRFSFRTRMLDYLWAELPILASEGDAFAELIERKRLGVVVPCQNEQAIADAVLSLIGSPEKLMEFRANAAKAKELFYWPSVTLPLKQMIERLRIRPAPNLNFRECKILFEFMAAKLKERGIGQCLKSTYQQFQTLVKRHSKKQ